jgi:hypothetical protein
MKTIRKSAVKGFFYDDNPRALSEQLNTFLSNSKVEISPEKLLGIIMPHAGYIYSGQIAAKSAVYLKEIDFDRAIVIGPSHYEYFEGASIYDGDSFETTFGEIIIDKEFSKKIVENSKKIKFSKNGERKEHSIEVLLPFLQHIKKDIKFVPILLGEQDSETVEDAAEALFKTLDDKTIVLSSSDLSHFYNKSIAKRLDERVLESIRALDGYKLLNDVANGLCEACGYGAIAILLKLAKLKGYDKSNIAAYGDSGDVSGDNNKVVGYVSAVIYK